MCVQVSLRVDSLCLIAEWLSTSYLESSADIRSYLEQAERMAAACTKHETRSRQLQKVAFQSGRFLDRQFQTLHAKQQSPEFEFARRVQASLKTRIAQHKNELLAAPTKRDLQYHIQQLEKELKIDTVRVPS
jgi:hypothetical protein